MATFIFIGLNQAWRKIKCLKSIDKLIYPVIESGMPKYDALRKTDRNEAVKKMHKDKPELSLQEIGDFFNISKQRVSFILMSNGDKAQ